MTEFHVSKTGHDGPSGSLEALLKTISAAAAIAQPGDCITVHQGTDRERVNPPREAHPMTVQHPIISRTRLRSRRSLRSEWAMLVT